MSYETYGEFLPDDAVPETLTPILQRLFAEHWPVMADTATLLSAWRGEHPNEKIPRSTGWHNFKLGEVTERRRAFPYTVWMMQRVLKAYGSLAAPDKAHTDAWLRTVGGYEALQFTVQDPVTRVNNKLVFVS